MKHLAFSLFLPFPANQTGIYRRLAEGGMKSSNKFLSIDHH